MDAYIRGLHYIDGGPAEDEPPAGDLLNPEAVACFIRLVYDKFYERFGQHFGGLIPAIFTDEPSPVGKPRERGVWPGTTGILAHVNRLLGYDFTPHLAALWHDDEPEAERYRADYERAIALRMEETWYAQLYDWCTRARHRFDRPSGQGGRPGRGALFPYARARISSGAGCCRTTRPRSRAHSRRRANAAVRR